MLFRPLSTPRLLLKNIGPEDEDFLLRQFSNEEVNRFLFDAEPFSTPADARELIAFYTAPEPRNRHRWVLVDRAAGEKLGTCGFHVWNREASACEMGYDLYPTHWHRGYMREALAAILAFARNDMGVQTVTAHIAAGNLASQKTASAMGFAPTGEQFMMSFHGAEHLHEIYALRL